MVTSKPTFPRFEKNQVGQVTVSLTVANHVDQILAERGFISSDAARSISITDVVVDTGATLLCLPTELIDALGLPIKGETEVKTAVGARSTRIFREAHLNIEGRFGTFDCLELQNIDQPLLGVLPMESLGLEPDLQNNRLRVLPMKGDDSYIYAM